jgi:DNA-binding response OmpR family regulator
VVLPSDMRLPKLSGLEVLQRLSASKDLPPTIILTTFDDDSTVVEGLRARRAATC